MCAASGYHRSRVVTLFVSVRDVNWGAGAQSDASGAWDTHLFIATCTDLCRGGTRGCDENRCPVEVPVRYSTTIWHGRAAIWSSTLSHDGMVIRVYLHRVKLGVGCNAKRDEQEDRGREGLGGRKVKIHRSTKDQRDANN